MIHYLHINISIANVVELTRDDNDFDGAFIRRLANAGGANDPDDARTRAILADALASYYVRFEGLAA